MAQTLHRMAEKVTTTLGLNVSDLSKTDAASLEAREKALQADRRNDPAHPSTKGLLKVTPQSEAKFDASKPMLAAEWHGTRKIVMAMRASPVITDTKDAIVRVTSASVCGTDLHHYQNEVPGVRPFKTGDIVGHEAMGVIESIGPEVTKFKVGDRVLISAVLCCGECALCLAGRTALCPMLNPSGATEQQMGNRNSGLMGNGHLNGGYSGGQSERVRVPFSDVNLLRVPDELTDTRALLLTDIVCTAWHGCELANVGQGDKVCVWGGGPVGLMTAYLALRVRGALRVLVVDGNEYRLRFAQSFGAETINYHDTPDVTAELHRRVPGGIDRSIDCAGFRYARGLVHRTLRAVGAETDSPEIITEMLHVTRTGGNVALIGEYFMVANAFPVGLLMQKDITFRGGAVYLHKYWDKLMQLVLERRIEPELWFTHQFALKDAPQAYDLFDQRADEVIKILLVTDYGLAQGPKLGTVQPLAQRNLPPYVKQAPSKEEKQMEKEEKNASGK